MITAKAWKLVLIIVVATVALVAMFALGRSEFGRRIRFEAVGAGRAPASISDVYAAPTQAPERKARMPGHAIVLPPADIQAADAIAQLKDAADHGSARAACRVAFELDRCQTAARLSDAASVVADVDNKAAQASVKRILDATDADMAHCVGVSPSVYSQAYRYQAIAAQGGDPAMQRWLMQKPALDAADFLAHMDEWADYKRRVVEYAPAAVHRKQLDDLMFLVTTYAPPSELHYMARVSLRNDATFLALVDAARENGTNLPASVARTEQRIRNSLSAGEQRRYEALSRELSGAWESSASSAASGSDAGIAASACEQVD